MTLSRGEALQTANKLRRTMGSAPDPRRQAQTIYSELARVEDWSASDQRHILAFGQWLATRPPLNALKAKAEGLLEGLG
ncbi:hypothetical protein [Phenylobacterium sp.]|uniref:hypothetical protein n=1 Tax=Phenylobacterium sp. TaxID=1871053 RepID=UPI0027301341|nr:hypothetical protein [Phenylobacterium sp.]MDP1598563.1 hypothetical protein [Phenylobacterium sp.]MDP3592857.1 hypothetical protein [Phenylobacterium sp.]